MPEFKFNRILIFTFYIFILFGCSSKEETINPIKEDIKPAIDKKIFENVHRAAMTVEGSIAVGVTYVQYGELLQKLSTEILILKDIVKYDDDKELLNEYNDLLMMYKESLLLWKYKIEAVKYDFIPEGRIYIEKDIEPIVEKYNLAKESHVIEITQHGWESISADSMQIIWAEAHKKLEKIKKSFK